MSEIAVSFWEQLSGYDVIEMSEYGTDSTDDTDEEGKKEKEKETYFVHFSDFYQPSTSQLLKRDRSVHLDTDILFSEYHAFRHEMPPEA
jgi:hypothetical protein